MRDYVIMTDSSCDLSEQEVAEAELKVLPLTFTMDGVSRRDTPGHEEMTLSAFYKRLREGAACTTAAVSVGAFSDAMRRILESGRDILCVTMASALSATYQSAVIAADGLRAEFSGAQIIVIDSLTASRGEGLLLWHAAQEKKKGKSLEEVADWMRGMLLHQSLWFTVASLNHLRRGGRLSATSALVGTVLSIKPIIHCDEEGKLVTMGKARGMKQAVEELVNKFEELAFRPLEEQPVFIGHADAAEDAEYAKQLLHDRYGVTDVRSNFIGPVIGSHTGPGMVGVFFFGSGK